MEYSLWFLNGILWIGPSIYQWVRSRGLLPVLDPQHYISFFVFYQLTNTMFQKWIGWMGETENGILYTSQLNYSYDENYYFLPLLFSAIAAIFFRIPFLIGKGNTLKSNVFLSALGQDFNTSKLFYAALLILSLVSFSVYSLIPNEGYGTFWSYALSMTNMFILFIAYKSANKFFFIFAFLIIVSSALILKSKAALLFPFLPFIVVFMAKFRINLSLRGILRICIIALTFFSLLSLGGFDFSIRKIMHRDYAFESFSALIEKCETVSITCDSQEVFSWGAAELGKAIPNIIHPDKANAFNPSKKVSEIFLPQDFERLPDAYYNRFIFFSGYYDFGLVGLILHAFFAGLIFQFSWSLIISLAIRDPIYLFLYLPAPIYVGYYLSVGAYAYVIATYIFPAAFIFLIYKATRRFRFS